MIGTTFLVALVIYLVPAVLGTLYALTLHGSAAAGMFAISVMWPRVLLGLILDRIRR